MKTESPEYPFLFFGARPAQIPHPVSLPYEVQFQNRPDEVERRLISLTLGEIMACTDIDIVGEGFSWADRWCFICFCTGYQVPVPKDIFETIQIAFLALHEVVSIEQVRYVRLAKASTKDLWHRWSKKQKPRLTKAPRWPDKTCYLSLNRFGDQTIARRSPRFKTPIEIGPEPEFTGHQIQRECELARVVTAYGLELSPQMEQILRARGLGDSELGTKAVLSGFFQLLDGPEEKLFERLIKTDSIAAINSPLLGFLTNAVNLGTPFRHEIILAELGTFENREGITHAGAFYNVAHDDTLWSVWIDSEPKLSDQTVNFEALVHRAEWVITLLGARATQESKGLDEIGIALMLHQMVSSKLADLETAIANVVEAEGSAEALYWLCHCWWFHKREHLDRLYTLSKHHPSQVFRSAVAFFQTMDEGTSRQAIKFNQIRGLFLGRNRR